MFPQGLLNIRASCSCEGWQGDVYGLGVFSVHTRAGSGTAPELNLRTVVVWKP